MRINNYVQFCILTCLGLMLFSCSNNAEKGEIIKDFGSTFEVENPDFETVTAQDFKVVFDVGRQFDNPKKVNPLFNTAARYLNMHAKAGVPKENMKVALVVHGSAAIDLLKNSEYRKRYQIDNPNLPLLTALKKAGVDVILCGQTAAHRKIDKGDIHQDVQIALSAMTALVTLQNLEYRLINF